MSSKDYIKDYRDDLEHVISGSNNELTYYFKKVNTQIEELLDANADLSSDLERAYEDMGKAENAYEELWVEAEALRKKIQELESIPEIRGYVVATNTGILGE